LHRRYARGGRWGRFLMRAGSASALPLRLCRPAPPPGHPRHGILWVAGRGCGLVQQQDSGGCR